MTRSLRPAHAILVAALVLTAVALAACSRASSNSIATVNGVGIPSSQVADQLAAFQQTQQTTLTPAAIQNYRAQALDGLIQLELIRQAADKAGIKVTAAQVDQYISRLEAEYGGKAGFANALKQAHITMAHLRDSITNRLLSDALMAKVVPTSTVNVTDAQVQAYYTTNKTQFQQPAQVHAEHILIAATDTATAQKVFAQAKSGADFATLAGKYSQDAGSAKSGGDLGWAAPSTYVPQFAAAVEKMRVDSYVLVKSQFGWHIIKLLGRRPAQQQPESAVSTQIKQQLVQTARSNDFTKYVAGLHSKADIVINDAALKKIIDSEPSSTAGALPQQ